MLQSGMDRILPARTRRALYSVAASRQIEADAIEANESQAGAPRLMVRAGIAAARLCAAVAPFADRVWIAAGPGNNGGDGIEAAIHLRAQGRKVSLTLFGDSSRLPADAAISLDQARAAGLTLEAPGQLPQLGANDVAVDALLGLGGSRAPAGPIAQAIDQLNGLACAIVAVDLPSGLDADSGRLHGDFAVRASHTLSLLTLKPGLFTAAGRDHAGVVWFDDLGISAPSRDPDCWLTGANDDGAALPRRHAQHKGSFGDVVVVGGAPGMSGAAVLCARAAHAAGAGRVWVMPLDPDARLFDSQRPELMWRRSLESFDDQALAAMTVVCGCGGGDAVAQVLPRLFLNALRLVIDADALNTIAAHTSLAGLLRDRYGRGQQSILTPHPLEAARLLGVTAAEVQHDRIHAAQELADRLAVVVILKGSGSVIAAPSQIPCINASGNAALASPGSGDVLAGWLAGIWSASASSGAALAEPPASQAPALLQLAMRSACQAVWRLGQAAETSGMAMLRAGDLIDAMARPPAP